MLFAKTAFVALALAMFTNGAAIPLEVEKEQGKFLKLDFSVSKSVKGDTGGHAPKTNAALFRKRGVEELTLYNEDVYYSVDILLGSNKQKLTVDLDTGSSDLWVIEKGATCQNPAAGQPSNYCQLNGVFDGSASSSYKSLGSQFEIGYVDGSSSDGVWATDDYYFANGDVLKTLRFGDVDSTSVNTGILGIAKKAQESNANYDNFPIQLKNQGYISTVGYSLYLNAPDAASGSIIFGGYDENKYTGTLATIPIVGDSLAVPLNSLTIGSDNFDYDSTPVILDSGTTLTYLTQDAQDAIGEQLGGTYYSSLQTYVIPCDQPSDQYLTYNFQGVSIKVPYSSLTIPLYDANGNELSNQCGLGVLQNGYQLLGDNFLRSALVVYNLDANTILLGQAAYGTSENIVPL